MIRLPSLSPGAFFTSMSMPPSGADALPDVHTPSVRTPALAPSAKTILLARFSASDGERRASMLIDTVNGLSMLAGASGPV